MHLPVDRGPLKFVVPPMMPKANSELTQHGKEEEETKDLMGR
jgi:hypothetical protein